MAVFDDLVNYFHAPVQGVVAVYLFGSHARAEQRDDSDVDIAVLFEEAPQPRLLGPQVRIMGDIERLLRRPVDVVILNHASVDLIHKVLRDGQLVADIDPSRRIAFEVKARNEYFDLLPYLEAYRRGAAA